MKILECTLNLGHFEKKESHSSSIFKVIDSEGHAYLNGLVSENISAVNVLTSRKNL